MLFFNKDGTFAEAHFNGFVLGAGCVYLENGREHHPQGKPHNTDARYAILFLLPFTNFMREMYGRWGCFVVIGLEVWSRPRLLL